MAAESAIIDSFLVRCWNGLRIVTDERNERERLLLEDENRRMRERLDRIRVMIRKQAASA